MEFSRVFVHYTDFRSRPRDAFPQRDVLCAIARQRFI